jgi:hypothetical protein
MGVDLYVGFNVGNRTRWLPEKVEDILAYVQCATGEWVDRDDLDLYRELRQRYTNERNQDKSFALWKLLHVSPFWRLDGSIGRFYRLVEAAGVEKFLDPDEGRCQNKQVIRLLLEAAGLNPDAADLADEVYWG